MGRRSVDIFQCYNKKLNETEKMVRKVNVKKKKK